MCFGALHKRGECVPGVSCDACASRCACSTTSFSASMSSSDTAAGALLSSAATGSMATDDIAPPDARSRGDLAGCGEGGPVRYAQYVRLTSDSPRSRAERGTVCSIDSSGSQRWFPRSPRRNDGQLIRATLVALFWPTRRERQDNDRKRQGTRPEFRRESPRVFGVVGLWNKVLQYRDNLGDD